MVNSLIKTLIQQQKKIGVVCIDPSSPFNLGALLGDRIRMSEWYNHPNIFIRSLATRGSLGGLNPKIIEICDVMKTANFDYIFVETVGVGQTEIEIAGLADCTIVVLVPEAGDEIQTMKAGLMEIANIFVVNKADRPEANTFVRNLQLMLAPSFTQHKQLVQILSAIAIQHKGVDEIIQAIQLHLKDTNFTYRKTWLLTQHLYQLIQKKRMADVDKEVLKKNIEEATVTKSLNIYKLAQQY